MQKKQQAAIGLLVGLALVASACGGNNGNNVASPSASESPSASATTSASASATPSEAPEVTLTVQYPTADNPVWITIADDQIKRYTEKYPNVTIKKNDWQYSPNEIGVKMAAHQAPSFFQTAATEGRTLVGHGWAADLTSYLQGYEHMGDINESLLEPFTFDGKIYALPSDAYMLTVTLNKKLFEAKNVPIPSPDWTWDEFYEAAKATTDSSKGIAGFAIMAKGNEGGWQWTNLLYQAGGEAQKIEGGKVVSTFQSDAGIQAMEFLKKLRWEGNVLPQNWALNYGDTYNLFKQGRAAIVFGNAVEDAVNNGGMNKDDLVVLPMPAAKAGGDHVGIMGGNFFIVNPQESADVQQAAFNYVLNDYFTDSGVESLRLDLESRKSKNQVKVPNVANYYKQDSEYGKKMQAVFDEYPETVFKFDDQVYSLAKGKTEPAYNGQDYYATLTNVMQEVLTDKNADVRKLLEDAAAKFDADFLSKVTAE